MNSRTSERFRRAYALMSVVVQQQAREAYRRFRDGPKHPSLQFKKVHPTLPVYSARVNLDYRAVGVLTGDEVVWFWIGPHHEYERLLKSLGLPYRRGEICSRREAFAGGDR